MIIEIKFLPKDKVKAFSAINRAYTAGCHRFEESEKCLEEDINFLKLAYPDHFEQEAEEFKNRLIDYPEIQEISILTIKR